MREIKFRVWNRYSNRFIDKGFIDSSCGIAGFTDDTGFNACDEYELSQFTGLKDKDGKEIYEGDIVKIINVCTCDNCKRYKQAPRIVKVDFLDFGTLELIATGGEFGNYETEIIGNIFENPELLGGKNE